MNLTILSVGVPAVKISVTPSVFGSRMSFGIAPEQE
jgi:hypothetical protein